MAIINKSRSGQALVLFALSIPVMFGFMALAVDIGIAYTVRKHVQAAADAASLAGAGKALATVGRGGAWNSCPAGLICQAATACPPSPSSPPASNIDNACLYAAQNGFTSGGNSGNQAVSVAANFTSPPPGAPGLNVLYWVAAEVSESVPTIFGGVFSSASVVVRSRSVAAIVQTVLTGSVIMLNTSRDCPQGVAGPCGVDLRITSGAGSPLTSPGGIVLGSTRDGSAFNGDSAHWAAENSGAGTVTAPFTYIRQSGTFQPGSAWSTLPTNGQANGSMFQDPMRGLGQPAAPASLLNVPVLNGVIVGGPQNNPVVLTPGSYYATAADGVTATGQPMRISGSVVFGNAGSGFGDYVFYGGLTHQGGSDTATFAAGRYVFAGALPNNGTSGNLFTTDHLNIQDSGSSGAGELFIFTDTRYPGLQVPPAVQPIAGLLQEGVAGFVQNAGGSGSLDLHGLNPASGDVPSALKAFGPVLLWQDQRNSSVKYAANGNLGVGCGNPDVCQKTAAQISADNTDYSAMQMRIHAVATGRLNGVIYQPRGARIFFGGNAAFTGAAQIIGGSLEIGGGSLSLQTPLLPMLSTTVALVH